MLNATVLPPRVPVPAHVDGVVVRRPVDDAALGLADAVAEFDAALEAGRPMFVLVALDREVAAAARRHRAALAEAVPA